MKSPHPAPTRLSKFNFRFSRSSMRSPISPLDQSPKYDEQGSLSICHSSSAVSASSRSHIPQNNQFLANDDDKEAGLAVTVIDSHDGQGLPTPKTLPTPRTVREVGELSPKTPWNFTFHRNAASTEEETRYLRQAAILRWSRIGLSALLLASAVTLTALQGQILHSYNFTRLDASFSLPLWPTDVNLTPTILTLITGVTSLLLALLTLAISLLPGPTPRTKLAIILFTLLTLVSTALSLSSLVLGTSVSPAAVFSSFVSPTLTSLVTTTGPSQTTGLTLNGEGSNPHRETLQSFTCFLSNNARSFSRDASTLGLLSLNNEQLSNMVPSGFRRTCEESKASAALLIVVLGLAVFGDIVAGLSWRVERGIARLKGKRVASREGVVDGPEVPESMVGANGEKSSV